MRDDTSLPVNIQSQIKELRTQQQSTLPVGSNPEYFRLQAKIAYLRYGPKAMYEWRKKNKGRIKYERATGIAYQSDKRHLPLTDKQRLVRNAAVRKHSASHPERSIRQGIERNLLMFYGQCSEGRNIQQRPRPRLEALLGCKAHQFREHIREQLALKGWLWSDWRIKWTMDHIIPVRKFKLPEEERSCWHYTNLRPLAKHLNHRAQRN